MLTRRDILGPGHCRGKRHLGVARRHRSWRHRALGGQFGYSEFRLRLPRAHLGDTAKFPFAARAHLYAAARLHR